jgi:hypothetical protein
MLDWTSDLEAAVAKKGDQFLLARSDSDGLKEYSVLPFDEVRDAITACPEATFYEVVLDGKCFLHLVVHFGDQDGVLADVLADVVAAMHKALPDIPLKDMQPHVSLGGIPGRLELRVVYRDVVLETLGACRQIAQNVAALLDSGSVQLDVYEHGHCSPIVGRIGA